MKKLLLVLFVFLIGNQITLSQNAVDLSATNNSISVNYDLDLTNGFTLEGWFKFNQLGIFQGIFGKTNPAIPQPIDTYLSSTNEINIFLGNGASFQQFLTGHFISDTNWHHIAFTYNTSTNAINSYVDGVAGTPATYTGATLTNTTQPLYIGNRDDSATDADAYVDDVRIWSTPKSAADIAIAAANNTCYNGSESNLEVYYAMTEGSGTTLTDLALSNGSQNGTINSGAWATEGIVPNISTVDPTGLTTQIYTGDDKTLANLTVPGTTITWYDATSGGNIQPNTTALVDETTYYASNTDACGESTTRLTVTVNRISDSSQNFCPPATVADLVSTPSTGATASWYTTASGGTTLLSTDALTTGTYYVEQGNTENIETLGSGWTWPQDIAIQTDGKILIADRFNNAIKRMDADGANIETLGSGFTQPTSVAVQADGKILLAHNSNTVVRMDSDGTNIVTLGSGFSAPQGIAVQTDGKILLVDNNVIKRMEADGTGVVTLGSAFNNPFTIAVQADGKILVSDEGNHNVYRMDADGNNTITLGSGFSGPAGLAIQADGKILVAEYSNSTLKRMDADGSNIETLNTGFTGPLAVAVQADKKILITDGSNDTVNRFTEASTSNRVAVTITINSITDQTVTVSPTVGMCSANVVVSLAASETGINYYLRDNANTIIEGPIVGDSNPIDFTSETITATKTYNVLASNGTGLNFDGTDDYIFANAPSLPVGSSSFTIELWVKPTSIANSPTIIQWGTDTTDQKNAIQLMSDGDIRHYWWFNDIDAPTSNLTDGNWHHIACTYNGTTRSVYLDGALIGSDTPSAPNVIGTNLTIGLHFSHYNGSMDDVRVWNTARTLTEINTNMSTSSPVGSGLVAHYKLDEYTGTNANDSSGNNQTAALINMDPATDWIPGFNGSCELQMTDTPTVTITAPEIEVLGNATSIADGDTTPDTNDDTDFGDVDTVANDVHTFTIDNTTGTADLTITSIISSGTDASDFVVSNIPTTVTAGNTDTFTLTFTPGATGTRTATITITSDDCDITSYDFAVEGNGVILCTTPEPTGLSTQIYTGDDKTLADLTVTGTTITWYDAASNGNTLPSTTALVDETTYYASNTDGCENPTRLAVTVNRISDNTQDFTSCATTVTDLVTTPSTGETASWFTTNSGGTAMLSADALTTGTYYVEQGDAEGIETLASGLTNPYSTAVQADGKILVAILDDNSIRRMDADGTNIVTLASSFNTPWNMVEQPDGKILVADAGNNAIKRMNTDGTNIVTLGSGFNYPTDIAIQTDGKIVVVDYNNNAIKRMNADGTNIVTLATGFNHPTDITIQADGKIIIADRDNNMIKRMDGDGTNIVTLGSGFNSPQGVAVQVDGKILVADRFNFAIKRMDADGTNIVTLASGIQPPDVTIQTNGKIIFPDINSSAVKRLTEASASNRVAVTVTVSTTPEPTGLSTQIYTGDDKTLADLTVTGTSITWYDATTGGNTLPSTTALVDETIYYASDTATPCSESDTRLAVTVNRISDNTQDFTSCATTVADLVTTPSAGTTAAWFTTSSGGTEMLPTDTLTTTTFYVEQGSAENIETLGSGFTSPNGVAVQLDGRILVANYGANTIERMNADGSTIETLGSGFSTPYAVVEEADGNILVVDFGNSLIKRMDSDGNNIETLGSGFSNPKGIAVQADGRILVADTFNSAIKRMDSDGSNIETLGSGFSFTNGVAVQSDGRILIAEEFGGVIKRMDADGNNIETLGSGFNRPSKIAVQADGKILIADTNNSAVKRMDSDGSNIVTLGSGFNYFRGIAVQADGKILIADSGNNTIKRLTEASASNRVGVDITVSTPEIDIKGNNTSIANGDTTPIIGDDTDFGDVTTNDVHTFTIDNTAGVADLTITSIVSSGTNAVEFVVGSIPSMVTAGNTDTFTVTFTPGANGIRTALISITNDDCDETTYDFVVQGNGTPVLSTNDGELLTQLSTIFPNPNNGNFTLSYSGQEKLKQLSVLDVTGKKVQTILLNDFNQSKEISLTALAQGMYFINIESKTNSTTKRIIIK